MTDESSIENGAAPTDDLLRELHDGVLRLTLNRPDAGNAITNDQRDQIIAELAAANADPAVRCVVLGATGRFFCTGADLRQSGGEERPEPSVGDIRRTMLGGTIRLMNAVLDSEKPVIAAVQGTAAGIGAHLAFCCDLVVVSDNAKFIEIFARRGLAVDGLGSWLLPRMVGMLRAKELVLLADDIPAARALELGLASRVVPADELAGCVDELAARLATGPTKAYGVDKWLINRSLDLDRTTMANDEAWVVEALSHSADAAEGVASFVERRPAEFTGR